MLLITSLFILLVNILGLNAEKSVLPEISLAHPYDGDFHIVFGMILTTFLIMVTFLTISVLSIWTMDPGRDSIIYRMTSQKIKKND